MLIEELVFAFAAGLELALSAILLLVELAAAIGGAVAQAVFRLLAGRPGRGVGTGRQTAATEAAHVNTGSVAPTPPRPRRKWPRGVGIAGGVCLLLTAAAAILLNTFFFEWSARRLLGGVRDRTGAAIDFGSASGNLFAGRVSLRDVTLRRPDHPTTTFDLRADTFDVDLDMWSMVFGPRRVESAAVAGLTGTVRRVGPEPAGKPWYAKRSVRVDRLDVTNAGVRWVDASAPDGAQVEWSLEVDALRAEQLSSRWAAFGLLYQTNASGRMNGRPFAVVNRTSGATRTTEWRFEDVPVTAFGDFVGGPFRWLNRGRVDVAATTTTTTGQDAAGDGRVVMNWDVQFRDVRAEAPAHLSGASARLAAAFVDYVNARGSHLPLSFSVDIDRRNFDGAASPEAAGLWRAVSQAAVAELSKVVGVRAETIEGIKQNAVDLFRQRFPSRTTTQPAPGPSP